MGMTPKERSRQTRLRKGVRRAFAFLREAHRQPEVFRGDLLVIPLERLLEGDVEPLSRERLRLLLELRQHGPFESISRLAEAVDRPRSRVSQDLEVLGRLNLVAHEWRGRKRRVRAGSSKIVIPVG